MSDGFLIRLRERISALAFEPFRVTKSGQPGV